MPPWAPRCPPATLVPAFLSSHFFPPLLSFCFFVRLKDAQIDRRERRPCLVVARIQPAWPDQTYWQIKLASGQYRGVDVFNEVGKMSVFRETDCTNKKKKGRDVKKCTSSQKIVLIPLRNFFFHSRGETMYCSKASLDQTSHESVR